MGRLYRRGETYYGDFEDRHGRRQRVSLKTRDRVVAKERLRRLELATTDPATHCRQGLVEALDHLLTIAMPAAGRASGTVESYEQKARHLVRVLGEDCALGDITRERVQTYVAARLAEKAARHSIHKELVVLRRALVEARDRGLYEADPSSIVPTFSARYQPKDRWLTVREVSLLLAEVPAHRRLWVALAAMAGLRSGEIERLRWEHVDLTSGWLRAPGTKTASSWRRVPILPQLRPWLELHDVGAGPVVEPWSNYRRDLHVACARAKIDPGVSANDLRRTFASWMLQAGVDLLTVSRMLGHRSTRMVEAVYGQLSEDTYRSAADRCAAFVTEAFAPAGKNGTDETLSESPENEESTVVSGAFVVPRDRIELPTRGFSGLVPDELTTRRVKRKRQRAG